RTGIWPTQGTGAIADAPGETWKAVQMALVQGLRSLMGGSSLAKLLAEHRGVRNTQNLPRLTFDQVLAWADAHHQRTGEWPTILSGPVHEVPGETWSGINAALQQGSRGLPGSSSLTKMLAQYRGVRNIGAPPPLTVNQILVWADRHHERT